MAWCSGYISIAYHGEQKILFWSIFLSARDSKAMAAIRAGMDEWTSKTCIRFKKRTNERAYANFKLGSG